MNVNPFSYLIEKLKSKADKGESAPPTDDNIPTNADLNNYTTVGFYHCGGGNTVSNKPTGVGAFGLIVIHSAGGSYYEQRLTDSYSKKSYVRYGVSGTWSAWGTVALTSDLPKSNDTLYGTNPGTTVSSATFANGHKASEYKFIAIEMYWGGLNHSLDVKVIPAQAWIGTDAFKLVNANGNVTLTVSNRTNTGFDIVANNGAVAVAIEGIY